jgi:hypothetical protein
MHANTCTCRCHRLYAGQVQCVTLHFLRRNLRWTIQCLECICACVAHKLPHDMLQCTFITTCSRSVAHVKQYRKSAECRVFDTSARLYMWCSHTVGYMTNTISIFTNTHIQTGKTHSTHAHVAVTSNAHTLPLLVHARPSPARPMKAHTHIHIHAHTDMA